MEYKKYAIRTKGGFFKHFQLNESMIPKKIIEMPYDIQTIVIKGEPNLIRLEELIRRGIKIHSIGVTNNVSASWLIKLHRIINNTTINSIEFKQIDIPINEIRNILPSKYCANSNCNSDANMIFINNEFVYLEAHHFNPYLNSKIVLNENGDLYSSLTQKKSINCKEILDLLRNPDGKKVLDEIWSSSKNKCSECSACEFRNMCIDSRIPQSDGENYFFNEKCDYNPNNGVWN